jgi:hypothetical protein
VKRFDGLLLLTMAQPPEPDLAPPMALRESSATLHEIMSVYDTSLVEDNDREADFAEILKAGVDPLVKMCQHMVDIWQKASEWDKNVFMTNCGLYLQVCLPVSSGIAADWECSMYWSRILSQNSARSSCRSRLMDGYPP